MLKAEIVLHGNLRSPKGRNLAEHVESALRKALADLGAEVSRPHERKTVTRPLYPQDRGQKDPFREIPQFGDSIVIVAKIR